MMALHSLSFFLIFIPYSLGCDVYLAPSKIIGSDRGIFAGKAYQKDSIVDTGQTILINYQTIRKRQLSNYVFSSQDGINAIALFGASMLYNHRVPKNIYYTYHEMPPAAPQVLPLTYSQPYSNYPMLDFVAEVNIEAYEEIFTSYGHDDWFTARGITLSIPPKYMSYISTLEELEKHGHCITDVYLNLSTIPLAGKGLFAKRPFRKGEKVSISPVLFLSKKILHKLSDSSVIINYCFCSESSDVCIFPIGLGGMMNHGGRHANVEIDWHNWGDEQKLPEKLSWSAEDLEKYPAAPLDIVYRASRDISAGEEIFVSYGAEWEIQWTRHLHELQQWNLKLNSKKVGNFLKPQFRFPISVPLNLFPEPWNHAECIDHLGCGSNRKNVKRKKQIELKDVQASVQFMEEYFRNPEQDEVQV
jgi:hypothetical protein